MKICPNCGTSVSDDVTFCSNCGASMNSAAPSDAANNQQAQSTPVQPAPQPQPQPAPQVQPIPMAQPGMQQNYQQGPYGQPMGQPVMQPYRPYDPKDHTAEFDPQDIADNKLYAVTPYLFSFVVGLIAGIYINDSKFLKFHIKNALRLDIASFICTLFFIVPVLGWFAGGVCLLVLTIVRIIAVVNTFGGKAKDVPIVGSIGFLK